MRKPTTTISKRIRPTKARIRTKTAPYDAAKQLRTPKEMTAYLDAWLEEAPDDAAEIARALGLRFHALAA